MIKRGELEIAMENDLMLKKGAIRLFKTLLRKAKASFTAEALNSWLANSTDVITSRIAKKKGLRRMQRLMARMRASQTLLGIQYWRKQSKDSAQQGAAMIRIKRILNSFRSTSASKSLALWSVNRSDAIKEQRNHRSAERILKNVAKRTQRGMSTYVVQTFTDNFVAYKTALLNTGKAEKIFKRVGYRFKLRAAHEKKLIWMEHVDEYKRIQLSSAKFGRIGRGLRTKGAAVQIGEWRYKVKEHINNELGQAKLRKVGAKRRLRDCMIWIHNAILEAKNDKMHARGERILQRVGGRWANEQKLDRVRKWTMNNLEYKNRLKEKSQTLTITLTFTPIEQAQRRETSWTSWRSIQATRGCLRNKFMA